MKIRPGGAELFYADRQTDYRQTNRRTNITELIVSFYNFANAPKNLKEIRWTGYVATMNGIEKHTHL